MRAEAEHQQDDKDPEHPANDGLSGLEDVDDALDGRVLRVVPDHRQEPDQQSGTLVVGPAAGHSLHGCGTTATSFQDPELLSG